jgi:hypothetical protein
MTNLEQIIREAAARSVVTTIARTTDAITDDYTRELLKDAAFKADMVALIRKAVRDTLTALNEPVTPPTP